MRPTEGLINRSDLIHTASLPPVVRHVVVRVEFCFSVALQEEKKKEKGNSVTK